MKYIFFISFLLPISCFTQIEFDKLTVNNLYRLPFRAQKDAAKFVDSYRFTCKKCKDVNPKKIVFDRCKTYPLFNTIDFQQNPAFFHLKPSHIICNQELKTTSIPTEKHAKKNVKNHAIENILLIFSNCHNLFITSGTIAGKVIDSECAPLTAKTVVKDYYVGSNLLDILARINYKESIIKIALKNYKPLWMCLSKEKSNFFCTNLEIETKENHFKKSNYSDAQAIANLKLQKKINAFAVFLTIFLLFCFILFKIKYDKVKNKNRIICEDNIRLANTKEQIEQILHKRELSLREIHHTVRNNLQILMSLLSIQAKEGNTADNVDSFLEKSQSRIVSISLIHKNLYENNHLEKIDFKIYVDDLIKDLSLIFNIFNKRIQFKINIAPVFIDVQTAIPLGLVINELVSNSYKHAFTDVTEGVIEIAMSYKSDKDFELIYSDNGIGFPIGTNTTRKSLGLELMQLLTNQIGGQFARNNTKSGTSFTIIIKEAF